VKLNKYSTDAVAILLIAAIGIIFNILKEYIFFVYWGTSIDLEVFRLAIAVPSGVSQLVATCAFTCGISALNSAITNQEEKKYRDILGVASVIIFVAITISFTLYLLSPAITEYIAQGLEEKQKSQVLYNSRLMGIGCTFIVIATIFRIHLIQIDLRVQSTLFNTSIHIFFLFFLISGLLLSDFNSSNEITFAYIASIVLSFTLLLLFFVRHFDFGSLRAAMQSISKHTDQNNLIPAFLLSFISLVVYRILNLIPKMIDRSLVSEMEQGNVAILEYSLSISNVPSSLAYTIFLAIFYRKVCNLVDTNISQIIKKIFVLILCVVIMSILMIFIFFAYYDYFVSVAPFKGGLKSNFVSFIVTHLWSSMVNLTTLIVISILLHQRQYLLITICVTLKIVIKLISVNLLVSFSDLQIVIISTYISEIFVLASVVFVLVCLQRSRNRLLQRTRQGAFDL